MKIDRNLILGFLIGCLVMFILDELFDYQEEFFDCNGKKCKKRNKKMKKKLKKDVKNFFKI